MTSASTHSATAPGPRDLASTATAREELIRAHLPLVSHVVRETMGRVPGHVSRDDLTSAGLMALVQASQSFDAGRGVPFAGFAAPRVRGAVLDELRRVDWASRSVRRTARSIDQTRAEMATILGRVPSTEEIASTLGMSPEEISRNEEQTVRAAVLSLQAADDIDIEGMLPSAGPTPEQLAEHQELLTYMVEAVAELPLAPAHRRRAVLPGRAPDGRDRRRARRHGVAGVTDSRRGPDPAARRTQP